MRTRLLAVTLALAAFTGCQTYDHVVPHDNAILLVDEGRLRTFRPVDIEYTPAHSDRHLTDTYLIPDEVRKFDKENADWAVRYNKEWHRGAVFTAARWISQNEPADQARWLVSANPTVVAIGPNPANSQPGGIRPVTINDLESRVSRVVILDPWQKPPTGTLPPPPANTRTLELQDRPTLRELLHQAPWAHAGK
jgi:hypothetical protein